MTGLLNLLPRQRAGKITILGITNSKRSAIALKIPTIAETVPGYDLEIGLGSSSPAALRAQKQSRSGVKRSGDRHQRAFAMDGIIDYSAIELGLIIGKYSSLALIVNLFDVELREDQTEPLLPVWAEYRTMVVRRAARLRAQCARCLPR